VVDCPPTLYNRNNVIGCADEGRVIRLGTLIHVQRRADPHSRRILLEVFLFTNARMMTIQKSEPLNPNCVPLPLTQAQLLKNGLPTTLPDIDVRSLFVIID